MNHFLSSTIVLETACGTFSSICEQAINIAKEMTQKFGIKNTVVEFEFNQVQLRVNENTDINNMWKYVREQLKKR